MVEGERDHAGVAQVYEVLVSGDKAFWPGEGFRVDGLVGTKSLQVMRSAEEWLDHEDDKAPFVTLAHPIPPGEVVSLSVHYGIEHDGEIEKPGPRRDIGDVAAVNLARAINLQPLQQV